jgi:hypothetical protein
MLQLLKRDSVLSNGYVRIVGEREIWDCDVATVIPLELVMQCKGIISVQSIDKHFTDFTTSFIITHLFRLHLAKMRFTGDKFNITYLKEQHATYYTDETSCAVS